MGSRNDDDDTCEDAAQCRMCGCGLQKARAWVLWIQKFEDTPDNGRLVSEKGTVLICWACRYDITQAYRLTRGTMIRKAGSFFWWAREKSSYLYF